MSKALFIALACIVLFGCSSEEPFIPTDHGSDVDTLVVNPIHRPLWMDMSASELVHTVPFSPTLFILAHDGVGPYRYSIRHKEVEIDTTSNMSVDITVPGQYTFYGYTRDAVDSTVCDSITIVGTAPEQPDTVSFVVVTNIGVSPKNKVESKDVEIGYTGMFHTWFLVCLDTQNRKPTLVEFMYRDGTRKYYVIPNTGHKSPVTYLVDVGLVWFEDMINVRLYWKGGEAGQQTSASPTCDDSVTLLEIHGSSTVPFTMVPYNELIRVGNN